MVFLNGGADTFNMLVPLNCPLYDEYHTVRKNVALDPSTLHKINASTQSCPEFGIHYELDFFKELYDSNELAFAANVGSLVEPLDKASYKSSGERQGHRVLQNLLLYLFFYTHSIRSRRWILRHDAKYIKYYDAKNVAKCLPQRIQNHGPRCVGLFSHSDQQRAAQTLTCQYASQPQKGAGGRLADALAGGRTSTFGFRPVV